jgi:hypothetical protein
LISISQRAQAVIEALKPRYPFRQIQATLKEKKIPCGSSWADLEGQFKDQKTNATDLVTILEECLKIALVAGNRYVEMYEVGKDYAVSVVDAINKSVIPDSPTALSYPLPPTIGQLVGNTYAYEPVRIIPIGDKEIGLVFSAIRTALDRTELTQSNMGEEQRRVFSGYDKVIGIKTIPYRVYDIIIVRPSQERIDVWMDLPRSNLRADYQQDIDTLFAEASNFLPVLQDQRFFTKRVNVFPAIKGIFDNAREGKILNLGHKSKDGVTRREKMPSKDDLRIEAFHSGGMTGIQKKITPFDISFEASFSFPKGTAEVDISSSAIALNSENPEVIGIKIRNAHATQNITRACDRVRSYCP